eukprot:1867984-Amphidinium_carterae.1
MADEEEQQEEEQQDEEQEQQDEEQEQQDEKHQQDLTVDDLTGDHAISSSSDEEAEDHLLEREREQCGAQAMS